MKEIQKLSGMGLVACKILRIIYTILNNGSRYDSEKMLKDIRHTQRAVVQGAA